MTLRESGAERIVDVDDAHRKRRPVKERGFRGPIGRHPAVVIEGIAREIREYGRVETHAAHAPLVERMGGHFHRNTVRARVSQCRELPVH